jgi:predicted nucleic acid-binding protein
MIVDASVLLSAFFLDEAQARAQSLVREHLTGRVPLKAPSLLPYELSNAVWQAERRGRVTRSQADEILKAMIGLKIEIISQPIAAMLPLARRFNCSAYDASYLALANECKESFITADERLYAAVHADLDWVIWLGDYAVDAQPA